MLCGFNQAGIGFFAQHLFPGSRQHRVDGDDAVTSGLHVARHIKTGAVRLGRQAHHRNAAAVVQDVRHAFGQRHGVGGPLVGRHVLYFTEQP